MRRISAFAFFVSLVALAGEVMGRELVVDEYEFVNDDVFAISASSDGTILAVGQYEAVRWTAGTGFTRIKPDSGTEVSFSSGDIAAGGETFVLGGAGYKAWGLWESSEIQVKSEAAAGYQEISKWRTGRVTTTRLSPEGQYLFAGTFDGWLLGVDLTGTRAAIFSHKKASADIINGLAVSEDGESLVAVSNKGEATIWSHQPARNDALVQTHVLSEYVFTGSPTFYGDGVYLASRDGRIVKVHVLPNRIDNVWVSDHHHDGRVGVVRFNAKKNHVYSVGYDGWLHVVDGEDGSKISSRQLTDLEVYYADIAVEAGYIAIGLGSKVQIFRLSQ